MAEKEKGGFFKKLIGGVTSSGIIPGKKLTLKKVHKLEKGQTLSHLALKYYGNATEPYWRLILDFNEDLDNEKNIWEGRDIKIPELPDDMKKK